MLTLQELEVCMAPSMLLNTFFSRPAPAAVERTFSRCHSDTYIVDENFKVMASLFRICYQQDAVLRVINDIRRNRAGLQGIGNSRQ